MEKTTSQQTEVDANFHFFMTEREALLRTDYGRFAVYRARNRVAILDTLRDALTVGAITGGFPFSVQEITDRVHHVRYG